MRLNKKQKEMLKKRKAKNLEKKEIDSNNLRAIIMSKKAWALNEKRRGLEQINKIQMELLKIEGIILFIDDLTLPKEKEEK